MGALGVVEADPTLDGGLPGPGLAKGSGVEAFLGEGAVRAFALAVLLERRHEYELVADARLG